MSALPYNCSDHETAIPLPNLRGIGAVPACDPRCRARPEKCSDALSDPIHESSSLAIDSDKSKEMVESRSLAIWWRGSGSQALGVKVRPPPSSSCRIRL
eukprot:2491314-Rhodomonas_salina.2